MDDQDVTDFESAAEPDADLAAQAAAEPVTPSETDALVERWWADHFPGSPVGQLTEAWNHAFAAKEDLKRRLAQR